MHRYTFTVMKENGLHVRMVATLIAKLKKLFSDPDKLKRVFLLYNGQQVPVINLLAVVSLKIKKGDQVTILFEEPLSAEAFAEIKEILNSNDDYDQEVADRLLMENSMTMEEVLANLPNGVVIVNRENVITYANKEAVRLLGVPLPDLLNRKAEEAVPDSGLNKILKPESAPFSRRKTLKDRTIIASRAPLVYNREVIGAIILFQDISDVEALSQELNEVKRLQEQLNLVLRTVDDLIGLSDPSGKFVFLNPAFSRLIEEEKLDNDVRSVVGERAWKAAADKRQPTAQIVAFKKNPMYIARLNPTIVDGRFYGSVLTLSRIDDMKVLLEQLEMEKERTKYLELELSKHQFDKAFDMIIGESETIRDALSVANKASKSEATVLITGESGTGKELVAKAIHQASLRKDKPFVRVNCAAIPPSLIESELFGHEKGAFTGAVQTRKGKFELANHGTIFLDEIGDLSLDLQAKLLRVLQEREIERVGGYETIRLDVRIIAATHQNLPDMVQKKLFREDLYFRLNVIPVHLPPLRKRRSDIPLLVDYFRVQYNKKLGKSIKYYEDGFIEALMRYNWPGNIRELQNIMERLITLAEGDTLYLKDLPNYIAEPSSVSEMREEGPSLSEFLAQLAPMTMEEYEREIYKQIIQRYPSFNQAAKVLGVTHKTVAAKVRKYGLENLLGKKYQES